MPYEFELLSLSDRPALVAISTPESHTRVRGVLDALGYKVQVAQSHHDFTHRFTQVPYQVVVLEESFDGATANDNPSLQFLQTLSMNLRRHAVTILVGDSLMTMHPMQAFAQSVHAVVNTADLEHLEPIIKKVVADNDLFYNTFRQVQDRIAQGGQ